MRLLIILAHPSPTSFNAALASAACDEAWASGHQAEIVDLYAEGFNPVGGPDDFIRKPDRTGFHYQSEQRAAALSGGFVADIAREQDRLKAADYLMLQFPIWWGGPPAILKGWIDRVSAYGVTYADGLRFDRGAFRGRRSLVSVTTGGTAHRFTDAGGYGDIETILRPVQRLFLAYLGYDPSESHISYAPPRATRDERNAMIDALRARVRAVLSKSVSPEPIPDPRELLARAVGTWSSHA